MIYSRRILSLVGLLCPPFAIAQAQKPIDPQFYVYELVPNTPLINSTIGPIAGSVYPHIQATIPDSNSLVHGVEVVKGTSGKSRLLFNREIGLVEVLPELDDLPSPAPNQEDSVRIASEWLKRLNLLEVDDQPLKFDDVTTLSEQTFSADGKVSKEVDPVRSVHFYRELDGLRVYGPNSMLVVDVGAPGVVGLYKRLQVLNLRNPKPVQIKTPHEATEQFYRQYGSELKPCRISKSMCDSKLSVRLIYYEQGLKYVQPVYEIVTEKTDASGGESGSIHFIAAAKTPIEDITFDSSLRESPKTPSKLALPKPISDLETISFGMYVIRDDDSYWEIDASEFHSALVAGNFTSTPPPGRSVGKLSGKPQYYWNFKWLLEPDQGVSDFSKFYIGSSNLAIIEGHGQPWWITSGKDTQDIIDLPRIGGLGRLNGKGGRTDYVVWKSCRVIPAPGDPRGGNYKPAASPIDVWWTLFKGLRGVYGYRTRMFDDDQVSKQFAFDIGANSPNLASWFHATDTYIVGHGESRDYGWGSAVVVSGHEQDTIYDTAPSQANSLTLWWQHP